MAMFQKVIGWFAVVTLSGSIVGVSAGGGAASWGEFGNNVGPTEDNGFSWPDSAESWAGCEHQRRHVSDVFPARWNDSIHGECRKRRRNSLSF